MGVTPQAAPRLREEVNSNGSVFGLPSGLVEGLLKILGPVGVIGAGHLGRMGMGGVTPPPAPVSPNRSEEHTSELQSLMRISYAVFCLKQKIKKVISLPD